MNKSFNDVQLFFEFLTVLNDPEKRKTIDGDVVDLLSNLDSSGKTNAAVELAKIYSWYTKMVDYDGTNFKIKADVIPAEVDTTYAFREGDIDGSFQVQEDDGAWQTIKIHNAATLDENGKVPSSQLPSYVDDVIDCYYDADTGKIYSDAEKTTEITPEGGIIYIDIPTNTTYRWSGTILTPIRGDLVLGEGHDNAYYGDLGKAAYEHSQLTSGNPHNVTKDDIGLGNVENKSSETIRGEITSKNVTDALGYTPADEADMPVDFVGATSSDAGVHGLVPAPESGKNESYLRGDATWGDPVEDFRTKINANTDVFALNRNNKPELLT